MHIILIVSTENMDGNIVSQHCITHESAPQSKNPYSNQTSKFDSRGHLAHPYNFDIKYILNILHYFVEITLFYYFIIFPEWQNKVVAANLGTWFLFQPKPLISSGPVVPNLLGLKSGFVLP